MIGWFGAVVTRHGGCMCGFCAGHGVAGGLKGGRCRVYVGESVRPGIRWDLMMSKEPDRTFGGPAGSGGGKGARGVLPDVIEQDVRTGSVRTIIMFGGSFDPVHVGHVGLVRAACAYVGTGCGVVLVPAARSPHKAAGHTVSADHRVAMLMLARQSMSEGSIGVWDDEVVRGGASYTVDTLGRLRDVIPMTVTLRLLMGEDQLRALHTWREPRRIVSLAPPLVYRRGDAEATGMEAALCSAGMWSADEAQEFLRATIIAPLMAVSSTRIRELLAARQTRAQAATLLPPGVFAYIEEHGLYREHTT